MNLEEIAGLVKIVEESSLKEFTYKDGDVKIYLSKLDNPVPPAHPAPPMGMPPMGVPMQGMPPMGMPMQGMPPMGMDVQVQAAAPAEEEEELYITSPIVGTFYSAPAPDVPAFVRVGDEIKEGQTVCILEAMKLMNEIQCDYDCKILSVLVSNEQKVEYGQPLFKVKKL